MSGNFDLLSFRKLCHNKLTKLSFCTALWMCQKTAVTTMLIQIVIFFNKLNIGVLLLLALGEGGGDAEV